MATTTTGPRVSPSTATPPTTASNHQPTAELAVLRPGGIGEVEFGTPADEAVPELAALLGPPDRVETIDPLGSGEEGCPEGAGWLDCVRAFKIIEQGQLAIWEGYGLEVALVDGGFEGPANGLRFGDWHATVAPGDVRLETVGGLYPAMTVGELASVDPDVEFTYNEGLLDSFASTSTRGAGYWGQLDWDPATVEIDWVDIEAVQAALNELGADLAVDGEWGPSTEAAWLAFLTDHGIEPVTPQLWLTPEIGDALGLPPDDITVATLEPRPATETVAVSLPILRSDGLDRFDFGEPANELVAELEAVLGPPSEDISYTPDGAGPFDFLPGGYWAAYELRSVSWAQPDLWLVLSDVPWLGDRFGDPTPGTLSLVSWTSRSDELQLASGIRVGSTRADLVAVYPNTIVADFDFDCGIDFRPARFRTNGDASDVPRGWRDVRGELDWDWVSDLQRALNQQGAELAVDAEYGPRTRAAVAEFQRDRGLDDLNGLVGPETANALELQAPHDAPIGVLEAGYPGSC